MFPFQRHRLSLLILIVSLDTMLSYMQMFAQTTNAIFLQKDIMENNSTTFRAMTELLNLDSLKPEDLNSESDMKTMIAAFKDLPNKVASEKEVEDAEKTFQVLLEMKEELKNVKQYDTWEPKEALKADLTDIEDHGFEIPVLANLKNAFTNININIDNILGYNPTSIDDRPSYFRIIETRCQEITSLAPETLGNIGEPVKFKSGYTAEDYISNLQPLFNLVHSLEEKKPGLSMPTDLLTNSAAAIASFSITVPPFLPILSALHSTFKNTTAIGGGRELLRTFGLPRGLTDLRIVDSLEKSYGKDKWLAKVSKVSKIAKGLKPLHVFVEKVEEVFKQLNSQRPVSMDQVYDYIQKFGASQIDPKAITDGASKCIDDEVLNDATALPDLSTLQSGLTLTETVLGDLKTVLNTVAEFVKSDVVTELLTGLKDIAGRASGALTQTVEDLKAYNLTEVREVFADFNKIVGYVDGNLTAIKTSAKENYGHVEAVCDPFDAMLDKRKAMFDCLVGSDAGQVASAQNAISLSGELRKPIPPTVITDLDKLPALAAILSKAGKMDVKNMTEAMKKGWSETSDKLGSMDNLYEHSQRLGEATRGLLHLRELLAHRGSFEVILKQKDILDANDLQVFNKTLQEIESWATSLPNDVDNIEKLGPMYKNAAKVPGIDNITQILDTVARMEEEEKDPGKKAALGKVSEAMEDLNFYGLNFTGYHPHYKQMTGTLETVSAFFIFLMTWETDVTAEPTYYVPPPPEPKSKYSFEAIVFSSWFLFSLLGVVVIGLSSLGAYCCWKHNTCCFEDDRFSNLTTEQIAELRKEDREYKKRQRKDRKKERQRERERRNGN
uniref:WSN domain-containing protein n=1 Tax=Caenorhabditis tropicalis TaxID=1561998 RepID=A0A1I7UZF9_9PELO